MKTTFCDDCLLYAVEHNDLSAIKRTLSKIRLATQTSPDRLERALILAVRNDFIEPASLLIDYGTPVQAREPSVNRTALILAAEFGAFEMTNMLLARGAAVDAVDDFGNSALNVAATKGNLAVTTLLLHAGADPNRPNDLGWTPLIGACEGGHSEVAINLIDAGADLYARNILGSTPLLAATQGGHFRLAEILTQANAVSRCGPIVQL